MPALLANIGKTKEYKKGENTMSIYKLYFSTGYVCITTFDGTEAQARAHFLHKVFNTADKGGGVLLARCIKIEKLSD